MTRITLTQGSAPWIAWRREGLGGSDIAAILGISPYEDATRESIFASKVHGIEREQNQAMYRGTVLEPHARALYSHRCRVQASPVCVEMDGCPWARVSLDGLCSNGAAIPTERMEWILELKCPGWETHDLALSGIVPEHFAVQCQWQMLVCGIGRCDYASFNPGQRFTPPAWTLPWKELLERRSANQPVPHHDEWPQDWLAIVPLKADAEQQAWIMEEAARFWFEVAEARAEKNRKITAEFA